MSLRWGVVLGAILAVVGLAAVLAHSPDPAKAEPGQTVREATETTHRPTGTASPTVQARFTEGQILMSLPPAGWAGWVICAIGFLVGWARQENREHR